MLLSVQEESVREVSLIWRTSRSLPYTTSPVRFGSLRLRLHRVATRSCKSPIPARRASIGRLLRGVTIVLALTKRSAAHQ